VISLDGVRGPSSRGAWTGVAAAWFVAVAALLAWLLATPVGLFREQLKALQFWSLESCVVVGIVPGVLVLREIGRGLERRDSVRMAALAVLALTLTVFVAPRTNRIYYDEQIYQNVGQNMADLKLAQICNAGVVEYGRLECSNGEYNKQPYAYPHLLSLAYRVFGVHEAAAFVVNAAAMAVTVCGVYLLVFILFSDRSAAFFAALLVALIPEQIVWSATAASEPTASAFCVIALVCAAHFGQSRSRASLIAAGTALAYSVQFRPESLLVIPVVGLMLLQRAPVELARPRFWWTGLLVFLLLWVHFGHMYLVRNEGWGTTDARLSLKYVAANFAVNGGFFLGDERFPILFTVLAFVGLASRRLAGRAWILLYFLLFFGIDLLFYAGSYDYGADVRYSLMTYPPLAVLGGLGASRVVGRVARFRVAHAEGVVAAGMMFQFLWYAPLVRAVTQEAWAARADVRFAKSLVPLLRGNAVVLTHNPGMFQVWGVNAGQMSLVVDNPAYLEYLGRRYPDNVYLHWNFWCNVQEPVQPAFCMKALQGQPGEIVREYREGDQRFALYRLRTLPAGSERTEK